MYKRGRRFLRHFTSCTIGGTEFCANLPRVQKGPPIFVPLYLICNRRRRFLRHFFRVQKGAPISAPLNLVYQKGALISRALYLVYKRRCPFLRHDCCATTPGVLKGRRLPCYYTWCSKGALISALLIFSCARRCANFCAIIPRAQKREPISTLLYLVNKRGHRFRRYITSCIKGATISAPLSL